MGGGAMGAEYPRKSENNDFEGVTQPPTGVEPSWGVE